MPEKLILRDWLSIRRWLEPCLAHVQCVSVDIFDTLLTRCVGDPAEVQRAVCRLLGEKLNVEAEQVWWARQQAEKILRQGALQAGFDPECRYTELVPQWLALLQVEPQAALCEWVQQTELDMEACVLCPKPDAQVFLDWVREQGIPLLAISDMYLDGALLRELLQRQGLGDYFHGVYVSADPLLGKYSGRLFAHVLKEQMLAGAQVVHIGDNPVSDRRMACAQGIQGIWLYEKAETRRRERQTLSAKLARRGGIWQGRHLFECVQARLQQHDNLRSRHALCNYGREVLGPAFSVFMQGLQERLRHQAAVGQGVDKLLFVARDGFLFQRMYQLAGGEIPSEYVYLSRRVIAAA
ncbi:MAG: HAD family hydrolase, partial [Thiothrix sp.]